jgi:predicted dehydrogenase
MKSFLGPSVRPQSDRAGNRLRIRAGDWTRRKFLGSAAKTLAVGSLAALEVSRFAHAAGSGTLRLGLVGCGGRGTAAAQNALATGRDVQLVAMADLFDEKIASSLTQLGKQSLGGQLQVPKERRFVGFDALERLLAAGVDGVILATPPGFRPLHFAAAASAGVHCFLEKPVAVDAPGIRQVRSANETARRKGLSAIVGLQDRFDKAIQALMAEIAKGTLGRITSQEAVKRVNTGPKNHTRSDLQKELGHVASELEFQIRNWFFFTWLSGDLIAEVLVHGIDNCLWAAGSHPQSARGSTERREHTKPDFGNVSDFLTVKFQYAGGMEMAAEMAFLANVGSQSRNAIAGELGVATTRGNIVDHQGREIWNYGGPKNDRYQEEFNQWCDSIRQSQALNTVNSAADSTLAAIMGRTAAYTGREVTWDQITASTETFFTHNPQSFQDDPPDLPDKFGDYLVPPRGRPS